MSQSRLVYTARWSDKWYLSISNNAKLLFDYICDNCNNAGVYEWNAPLIMFSLRVSNDELDELLKEIDKKVIISSDKEFIFIKNFLKHQNKLPLRKHVAPHREIVQLLLRVLPRFQPNSDIQKLIPSECLDETGSTLALEKSTKFSGEETLHQIIADNAIYHTDKKTTQPSPPKKTKRNNKFIPPTLEDVHNYMLEKAKEKLHGDDEYSYQLWAENCFSHYSDINWKVSAGTSKPSWKGIVSRWYNNNMEGGQFYSKKSHNKGDKNKETKNNSKLSNVISSSVSENIDFNS